MADILDDEVPAFDLTKENAEKVLRKPISDEDWAWLSEATEKGQDMFLINLFNAMTEYEWDFQETGNDPYGIFTDPEEEKVENPDG